MIVTIGFDKNKMAAIDKVLREKVETQKDAAQKVFENLGRDVVQEAGSTGSYQDRTGDLRSSVAVGITRDNKVATEIYKSGGTANGIEKAGEMLDKYAKDFAISNGFSIIAVAG